MSITDELREWMRIWMNKRGDLAAIADRIDAEHDEQLREARGEALMVGGNRPETIDAFIEANADAMAEHGWVRLPKDADGVPWRVGDRVHEGGERREVAHMDLASDGWRIYLRDSEGNIGSGPPDRYRHHHELTTEDVLMDMLAEWAELDESNDGITDVVAKYAKRLTLRGGDA